MKKLLLVFAFVFILSNAFAEIPIYCPKCKTHLYNYQKDEIIPGSEVRAEDFKPANDTIEQPQENTPMVCPIDKAPLNGYEYINYKQGMKPPQFYAWAITMLTKKDGKWVWVPYDLEEEYWE